MTDKTKKLLKVGCIVCTLAAVVMGYMAGVTKDTVVLVVSAAFALAIIIGAVFA